MAEPLLDFLNIVSQPEKEWNLFDISLQLSRMVDPDLDLDRCRQQVAEMVQRVQYKLSRAEDPYRVINTVNEVLFDECQFCGNLEDYYSAENSYMSCVLAKRKGIPVSLSVLYGEIAAQVGLFLLPVAMPGHFLLKYFMPQRALFIDAFNRGEILLEEECPYRLEGAVGHLVEFKKEFLNPASPRQVILRILMNLKVIYREQKNTGLLLEVLDRRIPLLSDPLAETLERGFVRLSRDDFRGALNDLEFFVEHTPDPKMKTLIEKRLLPIRQLARSH